MSKIELGTVSEATKSNPSGTTLEGVNYVSCNDGSGRIIQAKFTVSGPVGTCDDPLNGEDVQ